MKRGKFLNNTHVRIISADIPGLLSVITDRGLWLAHIKYVDELTIEGYIPENGKAELTSILESRSDTCEIVSGQGIGHWLRNLSKRSVLLSGISLLFLLTSLLPNWIFFIGVVGNHTVPATRILEAAQSIGIGFGSYRRGIRNEEIKNALLLEIPELTWVGINTSGCVATISVKEGKQSKNENNNRNVSSIVAKNDGVITEIMVTQGTALQKVGMAVKEGDVLISGYTDCGLLIKAEQAKGEIYAQTKHQISAITPSVCIFRGEKTKKTVSYRLCIGKNFINLWKDSGIWDTTCVKIYEQCYLTLPGGFQLPISLITERQIAYRTKEQLQEDFLWLTDVTENYLLSGMTAGTILDVTSEQTTDERSTILESKFTCHEMIGKVRYEETIANYVKSD